MKSERSIERVHLRERRCLPHMRPLFMSWVCHGNGSSRQSSQFAHTSILRILTRLSFFCSIAFFSQTSRSLISCLQKAKRRRIYDAISASSVHGIDGICYTILPHWRKLLALASPTFHAGQVSAVPRWYYFSKRQSICHSGKRRLVGCSVSMGHLALERRRCFEIWLPEWLQKELKRWLNSTTQRPHSSTLGKSSRLVRAGLTSIG